MSSSDPAGRHSRTFVTAFARGLDVIASFGPGTSRMTLSEVAKRTGLDRSVARRLLLTLVELGLAHSDGKQFELTPRILRLGNAYLSAAGFDSAVQSYLDELAEKARENASITVLDFPEVVNIARAVASERHVRLSINVSGRLPAVSSASGRVLLSQLPDAEVETLLSGITVQRFTAHTLVDRQALLAAIRQAREAGHALVANELALDYIAISVPLRNRANRVVAALNMSTHSQRHSPAEAQRLLVPLLQRYAAQIRDVLR